MSKIDGQKINKWIAANKEKKPEFCNVDLKEWQDALDGYCEMMYEGVTEETTTQELWNLIFFSAMAFCRGMEGAEVKAGLKPESLYPRY